ncbi:MAG: adenine phosphoribosyltransferase [Erysipelotrichia bacterium]|jgi:adenine phosphoribosyltransferase|nr:adenine phosphoribosyltransferase [Erysipelotrichia bacterium]
MNLYDYIASIPDYPIKGILFRDVTPAVQDGKAFREVIRLLVEYAKKVDAEVILGPESRGFIFGCPVAYELNIGFVPARKPNKLPREVISAEYELEYGTSTLEIHKDAIKPGQKVLVIDDLLATGGTIKAANHLVEQLGGIVVGNAFLIELVDLKGREELKGYDVYSILEYEGE